jgi:hypothetical protein
MAEGEAGITDINEYMVSLRAQTELERKTVALSLQYHMTPIIDNIEDRLLGAYTRKQREGCIGEHDGFYCLILLEAGSGLVTDGEEVAKDPEKYVLDVLKFMENTYRVAPEIIADIFTATNRWTPLIIGPNVSITMS